MGQLQASAALFPGNEHPAFTENEKTWENENFLLLLPGVKPRFFGRPIRSRYYTDWAILLRYKNEISPDNVSCRHAKSNAG